MDFLGPEWAGVYPCPLRSFFIRKVVSKNWPALWSHSLWVVGSSWRAVILKAKLAETTFPKRSIRMCSSVTPNQATLISNSDLNLWKSLLKGGSSIFIVDRLCREREAQSVGMNFSTKSTSIFSKVRSSSLTFGLAQAISHPSEKDFPLPLSILFRNARILFFSW